MQSIEQLIQKFWSGQASQQEINLLVQMLEEHDPVWAASLKAEFYRINEEGTTIIEPAHAGKLLDNIHGRIANSGESEVPAKLVSMQRNRVWRNIAVAIILLVGTGTALLLTQRMPGQKEVAAVTTGIGRHVKSISNNEDTVQTISLQDGSKVLLSGHSAISYYEPFGDSARDISLVGEAKFIVFKNAARPFTVYANGIATTALGTVFTVSTLVAGKVNVMLLEGKVVIHSADPNTNFSSGKVFLTPGQQFTIDKMTNTYLVNSYVPNESRMAHMAIGKTEKEKGNAVMLSFDHEPLYSVFRQLNSAYKADIRFDKKEISELYFSGNILKSDSLQTVLAAICNMNQLSFTEQEGFIRVRKSN